MSLGVLAAVALVAFVALSFYDGVVVHLLRERLHTRPAARLEHRLHTARAALFPLLLVVYFAGQGPLWLAACVLLVDQCVEIADMAVERRSRAHSGGLPSMEYVVHGLLITLRSAAVVLTWAAIHVGAQTDLLRTLAWVLLPGAVLAAVVHGVLIRWPCLGSRACRAEASAGGVA
jgi:hypothetical protein